MRRPPPDLIYTLLDKTSWPLSSQQCRSRLHWRCRPSSQRVKATSSRRLTSRAQWSSASPLVWSSCCMLVRPSAALGIRTDGGRCLGNLVGYCAAPTLAGGGVAMTLRRAGNAPPHGGRDDSHH